MRPDRPPSAKFLSFTTRFRILGPVLLTNWNRLGDLVLRVGAAGLFVSALADDIRDTDRLGLADLELLVVISGAERWCLGVLPRASIWTKLISDVSDSDTFDCTLFPTKWFQCAQHHNQICFIMYYLKIFSNYMQNATIDR